jgi:peptidoglycan L-alanyl-D-glutamate endopeptidase CwlK
MDSRSLTALETLHPAIRPDAIAAWTEVQAAMAANVKVIVIQGYRTFAESNALYAQGRTAPGDIVTFAPAGESFHNYGLAFDFAMVTNGKDDYNVGPHWMQVVTIMKKHGWTWGGDFPKEPVDKTDNPHFEKKLGHNWRDLLALHNAGKFIPGTTYVEI